MQTFVSLLHPQVHRLGSLIMIGCLFAGFSTAQAQANKPADDARLGANRLFQLGLYEQAIKSYAAFLKKWPTDPKAIDVQYGMGAGHFQLKQYDKAEAVMGKVVGNPKCPDKPRANFIWGQSLLMLRKPANAEGAFDIGIKALPAPKTPADVALLANLKEMRLEALYQQKKWKDVVTAAAALKGKGGNRSTRVSFQGAFALYQLKQYLESGAAFTALKPSVKGTKLQQQTHFLLGECLRKQNKFPEAIQEFGVAAGLEGDDAPEALFRMGILQFNLKDFKAAAKHFDDFRVKFKDQVMPEQFQDARIFLGRAQVELKQFKLAEKVFADLAAEPEAAAKVFLEQGRMLQSQKKYAEAVKVLAGVLNKFPNDPLRPELLFDFANNHLGLKNFADAGQAFDDLRKAEPKFKEMAVLLHLNAVCKHNTKDFANSLKLCGEFLAAHAQHPRKADVTFLQCENQFFLNAHPQAIAGFKAFSAANGKHPKVKLASMRVGQSEYELKQWAKVLAVLEPLMKAKVKGQEFDQLEFLVAESYYRQENWAKAVPMCLLFAETKPSSTNADTALLMAGLASEKLKKPAEAIAAFQKLDAKYPRSVQLPPARVQLGILYYEGKKYPQAKVALQKVAALKEHPLRPKAEYFLAFVELKQGNAALAAKQFGALADSFSKHELAANSRLQQGLMLFNAEKFAESQQVLQKFIADFQKHELADQATFHLGFARMKQEQWQPALEHFAQVPAKSEWRDDALYRSAWCEKGAGKPAAAMAHYEDLLKAFPGSLLANNATLELAGLNFEAKKLDDVIKSLEAMIARKPGPKRELLARARYQLGGAYYEKKNHAEGAKAYEAMLANAPKDLLITAAWQAGECRRNTKEYAEALANFRKAVAAPKPEEKEQLILQEQALLRVGQCQGLLNQWPASEQTFKKFIAAHPKHDQIRAAQHGLGTAMKNQKKYADALAAFGPVLSDGTRDDLGAHAQFLVGECYLEQDKFDDAIAEFVKVEALFAFPKWQSKAVYEMAQALDRKGEKAKAREQYLRLVQKYPDTEAAKAAKAKLK
jgi:TolA-binding protein